MDRVSSRVLATSLTPLVFSNSLSLPLYFTFSVQVDGFLFHISAFFSMIIHILQYLLKDCQILKIEWFVKRSTWEIEWNNEKDRSRGRDSKRGAFTRWEEQSSQNGLFLQSSVSLAVFLSSSLMFLSRLSTSNKESRTSPFPHLHLFPIITSNREGERKK